MGLLHWFQNMFKQKPKALPEPAFNEIYPKNSSHKMTNREQFLTNMASDTKITKPNTIEHAIDQYLMSLYYIYKQTNKVNSYQALTTLQANANEEPGQNKMVEKNLIQKIRQNPNLKIHEHYDKDGILDLYHIYKKNYDTNTIETKLYLNLARKNIAAFCSELLTELKDQNFYFKFFTDDSFSKTPRTEGIVIYTTLKDINPTISAIDRIEKRRPSLTQGTHAINPFMKKVNSFTGLAPHIKDHIYINEQNQKLSIPNSYNTLLCNILEDSYVSLAKGLIARDESLTRQTNGIIFESNEPYVKLFPVLHEKYQNQLIDGMKLKLEKAMERNPNLDIPLGDKDDPYLGN